MDIWLILNLFSLILFAFWSKKNFDKENDGLGWMYLFFSAWNAASFAVGVIDI